MRLAILFSKGFGRGKEGEANLCEAQCVNEGFQAVGHGDGGIGVYDQDAFLWKRHFEVDVDCGV